MIQYENKAKLTALINDPSFDPNEKDKDGDTLLHAICQVPTSEKLKQIINHPNLDGNVTDIHGRTALWYICHIGGFYETDHTVLHTFLMCKKNVDTSIKSVINKDEVTGSYHYSGEPPEWWKENHEYTCMGLAKEFRSETFYKMLQDYAGSSA